MGLVAPMTALIAASVPAVLGLLGGDPVGPVLAAGMVIALGSVVVISSPERGADPTSGAGADPAGGAAPDPAAGAGSDATAARTLATDWLLVIASGLGFAAFFLCVDRAHDEGSGTYFALLGVRVASSSVAILGAVLLVGSGRAQRPRASRALLPFATLTALGDTGGNVFYILANAAGTLSTTVVLASLYPVSTALLARAVLGERLSRRRQLGVLLAVAGVVLISAGSLGL
jgi:drug/metabolite transporter (DMT)-like permease